MGFSVIIPAHNESKVIVRCLGALTAGAAPGELEVIVACNGCTDHTAAIARAFAPVVRVVESSAASKSLALNLGDLAATKFPRFYVDADVVLPLASARQVAAVLEQGDFLAAAPRVHFDCSERSWAVRAFYEIWDRLPYCAQGMIGTGVYAVSEQGRRRFSHFPKLTADDAFVRLHYRPDERTTVETCRFVVTTPTNLRGVIRIKTRSRFGNYELRAARPRLFANEGAGNLRELIFLARDARVWPKIAVYLFVVAAAAVRCRVRYYFGDRAAWERDETSRDGTATGAIEVQAS